MQYSIINYSYHAVHAIPRTASITRSLYLKHFWNIFSQNYQSSQSQRPPPFTKGGQRTKKWGVGNEWDVKHRELSEQERIRERRQRKMRKVKVEQEKQKTYNRKELEGMEYGREMIEPIYLKMTQMLTLPFEDSKVVSLLPIFTQVHFLPSLLDQRLLESKEFL